MKNLALAQKTVVNSIDWNEIHQRMENAHLALLKGAESSSQASRAILRSRAVDLSQEPPQTVLAREYLEILVFNLAAEVYGLETSFVREVYPLKEFTALPGVPPFVLGIINVRGQILSVIDLVKFMNLQTNGLGQLNKLIVLRNQHMEFGILADEIVGVRSIALDMIQAAPPTVSGIGAEFLRGVTAKHEIILDAAKILNDNKIIVHQLAL